MENTNSISNIHIKEENISISETEDSLEDSIIEFISGRSVLELSELVKEFEEKFGTSAYLTKE